MNKSFNLYINQIELKKGKWSLLDKNILFKNFPKIKKLILRRNCKHKIINKIMFHEIDFKIFSKLDNLETLGIIDNHAPFGRTEKVYKNFLEILKLKRLKTLYINTDFVSSKDLLKLFNKKAGLCEKFLFKYNLKNSEEIAEFPPIIYEDEMDEKSWRKYNSLKSKNIESNFEIKLYEKDKSETSLVEVAILRMREDKHQY